MNQKRGSEEVKEPSQIETSQSEISWEEAVARYLEDQPDFLLRHPQVLARLTLKHEVSGAVSLIEHQVQTLRAHGADLERQLRDLVGVARDNDALGARLHQFALAMLGARSAEEALDAAGELLRREFRVDAVAVRIRREPAGTRPEYVSASDRRLSDLLGRFENGRPLLDGARDESLRGYLFGGQAAEIRACALIPLGNSGVLALGAHDAARFHPGMGTVYLARLGELLARALAAVPS
jgi:uncharacterized protein YigA (DUF484 family)